MNTLNALAFAFLGAAMEALPRMAPGLLSAPLAADPSASAVWLHVMGAVLILTGTAHLARTCALPALERMAAWAAPEAVPGTALGEHRGG